VRHPSAAYAGGEPLAEVVRSGFAESFHRGSVAVLDADARVIAAAGDVAGPVFPRSALKPLQAVGMLRAGLRVPPADLALICGSHRGQPVHLVRVRAMLTVAGLDESALQCPPDHPLDESMRTGTRSRVQMNCSGQHAGMLLTCRSAGWPVATYLQPDHPLQISLRDTVADLVGEPAAATGVDGCGAPVFAMSLRGLAVAFLRLVSAAQGTPERAVADAMRQHPEQVSGTDAQAQDTVLMRASAGLLAKGGAEGVHAAAHWERGAVALKIDDGGGRARMPVLGVALRRLGLDLVVPAEPVRGGGLTVGEVRAVWTPDGAGDANRS
jgi:L-asparaginase II